MNSDEEHKKGRAGDFDRLGAGDDGASTRIEANTGGDEVEPVVLLSRLSDAVNASDDLESIGAAVLDEAAAIVHADSAAVFLISPSHYISYLSGFGLSDVYVARLEELARSESASSYIATVTHPVFNADVRADVRQGSMVAEYRDLLLKEGILSFAVFPLINRDRLLGFLALFAEDARDLSKDRPETLHTVANMLALAVANVQFTNARRGEDKARDRFLSALNHELRTPLTSIMGFAQVIRKRLANEPAPDPRLVDQMEVLWTQAQRLNRLIDTFVDLSNIERGEFEIDHGKVDLVLVLRAAVQQAKAQARSKQVVELKISEPAILVHGDGKRLEQVFTHVVSNALRHSPPDRPIIVRCEVAQSSGAVVVEVVDRGSGIPPHMRRDIFERQGPGDAQRSGGLGVGLYLSKKIVEAHGGHVELQSSADSGTTVTIALPL